MKVLVILSSLSQESGWNREISSLAYIIMPGIFYFKKRRKEYGYYTEGWLLKGV
jgi:hypothetical protein